MTFSSRELHRDASPSQEQGEDLGVHGLEAKFIDRVVEALPLAHDRGVPAADELAHQFVAEAFIEWFTAYRRAFEDRLRQADAENRGQLMHSYAAMLEHVALREASSLPAPQDQWQRGDLLAELEAAAQAFYRAMLQRQGWIETYGLIFGDDTPEERYAYLKLVNRARGFLRRTSVGSGERAHLQEVGLMDVRAAIVPRMPLQKTWDPRLVFERLEEASLEGAEARQRYDAEREAGNDRRRELAEFREWVQDAIKLYGDAYFSAYGASQGVKTVAQRLLELETERRRLYRDHEDSEASMNAADRAELTALFARREELKAFLKKARLLLQLHQRAEQLGLLPSAPNEPVRLGDILEAIHL
jgi:hypothetical protein